MASKKGLVPGKRYKRVRSVIDKMLRDGISDTVVVVPDKEGYEVHELGPDAEAMDCVAVGLSVSRGVPVIKLAITWPESK